MRRSLIAVLASLAALWAGVAAAAAVAPQASTDADAHAATAARLAAVAPAFTPVASRDGDNKTGPLFALAVVLSAAALAAIGLSRGRVVSPRVALPATRIASRGWSRRGPPRHLVLA